MKIPRGLKRWAGSLGCACIAIWLTGCEDIKDHSLTGSLWDNDFGANYHQPATNANVRFFQSADHKDVLVTYNEESEKNGRITHRAFLLHQNEELIESRMKPRFVGTNQVKKLEGIPMVVGPQTNLTNSAESGLRAVISEDGQRFTIIKDGVVSGPYQLPVYLDNGGKVAQIVLTPATVTGDIVIYSVVFGSLIGIYWVASGGLR